MLLQLLLLLVSFRSFATTACGGAASPVWAGQKPSFVSRLWLQYTTHWVPLSYCSTAILSERGVENQTRSCTRSDACT